MTVHTLPDKRTDDRGRSYSLLNRRFPKYPKRSILSRYEASVILVDFDSIEGHFYLPSARRGIYREAYSGVLLDMDTSIAFRVSSAHSYNPAEAWLRLSKQVVKRPSIGVSYDKESSVYTLLGAKGKIVLNRLISLVRKEAEKKNWPLTKIEVCYEKDSEVEDWEYIVVLLYYDSSFEEANRCLSSLYGRIDDLAEVLNSDEKKILAELIYIDIKTNDEISSS